MALGIVLVMSLLVAGAQLRVAAQLRSTNTERDYERALLVAETGANVYLAQLTNTGQTNIIPARTLVDFKTAVKNRTISLTRYPAGSEQGYYVGQTGPLGASVTIYSYGWSNGVVRRIKVNVKPTGVLGFSSVYALNPSLTSGGALDSSSSNYSWRLSGGAGIIGSCGAEGRVDYGANNGFYDGPLLLAGPYARFNPSTDPTILQSMPNVPDGHTGTGILASPPVRRYFQRQAVPTVDETANALTGATTGAEYFRTNNNNATGLRYLVRHKSTGVLRELRDPTKPYTVMSGSDFALDGEFKPSPSQLTAMGMLSTEDYFGIRAYPGNYFFDQISMQTADRLYVRSFADSERALLGRLTDPVNPNPGRAEDKNVRMWIGRRASGDVTTGFNYQTVMEYTEYASRFRVYVASTGGVSISGINQSPPPPFRVNLLAYNKLANGTPYGSVSMSSSTYLFGSMVAWQVSMGGGGTVEAQVMEFSAEDRLSYEVIDWSELQ